MTNFIRYFAAAAAIGGLSAPLAAQNSYPRIPIPRIPIPRIPIPRVPIPSRAIRNRAIRNRAIPTITTRAMG